MLYNYDCIPVPLVYTQVVILAVYFYTIVLLITSQPLDPEQKIIGHEFDTYFPAFNMFQFIFYMGFLKVSESLLSPLGDGDYDFQINYFIDRNLQVRIVICTGSSGLYYVSVCLYRLVT